jgi:TM2 domain-containing membrane protein YozV
MVWIIGGALILISCAVAVELGWENPVSEVLEGVFNKAEGIKSALDANKSRTVKPSNQWIVIGVVVAIIGTVIWFGTSYHSGLTVGVATDVLERSNPFSRMKVLKITRIRINREGNYGVVEATVVSPDYPDTTIRQEFYFSKFNGDWYLSR